MAIELLEDRIVALLYIEGSSAKYAKIGIQNKCREPANRACVALVANGHLVAVVTDGAERIRI